MNISFVTDGPDAAAHLQPYMKQLNEPSFAGLWATIDLQPDLFSPQRFCVGIAVADIKQGFVFRLLTDVSKFECIYARTDAASIRTLIESAERALLRAAQDSIALPEVEFESDNLSISQMMPTSGQSAEAVLSRLYAEVVAMEPRAEKPPRPFVSLDTAQVRQLVANELKRIGGTAHERVFISPNEVIVTDEAGGTHELDVTLRSAKGAGSIVSAVYKTPATIELNLLRASRDLSTYAHIRRLDDLALFVMSASGNQFAPLEYERISELLDEQSWRLERQGFRVTTFDEPTRIAEGILEWAHLA
jgi:hypothetical protein